MWAALYVSAAVALELPLVLDNASLRLAFGAADNPSAVAASFTAQHGMGIGAHEAVAARVRGVQRACAAAGKEAEAVRRALRTPRAKLPALQLCSLHRLQLCVDVGSSCVAKRGLPRPLQRVGCHQDVINTDRMPACQHVSINTCQTTPRPTSNERTLEEVLR